MSFARYLRETSPKLIKKTKLMNYTFNDLFLLFAETWKNFNLLPTLNKDLQKRNIDSVDETENGSRKCCKTTKEPSHIEPIEEAVTNDGLALNKSQQEDGVTSDRLAVNNSQQEGDQITTTISNLDSVPIIINTQVSDLSRGNLFLFL